jgi:hypothetical protein
MDIYAYNGSEIVKVLEGLVIEHTVSMPGSTDFKEDGVIDGSLKDFTYTLTRSDNMTGKESIEKKIHYTYNANAMKFDEKVLMSQTSENETDKQSGYSVKDGSLYIVYDGKTRAAVEADKVHEIIKDDGSGPFALEEKLYVLRADKMEGNKLYFTVKAPDYSDGEVHYYLDMQTLKIYLIGSNAADMGAETGEGIRLSGFSNETIRDVQIDYGSFSAVIIPFYPSNGKNVSSLAQVPFIDNPDGTVLEFAVFGKLEDVKISYYENMESDGVEKDIGELENSILNIHSNLQTDMSYYKVSGKVHVGEGLYEDINFTLDGMRDTSDYDVYTVK